MPHIKMARKSTDTDMTPFVDIAFLILSFFIMATKFKPPEPIKITTPNSVSADILKETDAVLITIDNESRVFINIASKEDLKNPNQPGKLDQIIQGINTSRNLNLTPAEMQNFKKSPIIGAPFANLKTLLQMSPSAQANVKQPGIPVLDTLNNELIWWISEIKKAFAGKSIKEFLYLIKGDNKSKFPTFEAVINAMRKNDQFKYNLITSREGAPEGTELYIQRLMGTSKK
ncbi:MAG TPA: biopolymer transporter ExbD [Chitinophagaceae bacterium]|nr:biopolymer transporter ExbD [Chitinophagaceae bacterium]